MFRKNVGRLLIVVAGGGCLAVLIFVALPMMDEPAPLMSQDEIVAQVLGSEEPASEGSELEAVTPSPLVGVRNDGEEVAVIFQAAEPEAGGSTEAAMESRVDDSGLLQALSSEDVAAARSALEAEPVAPVEDLVAAMAEAVPAEARETAGPVDPGGSEGIAPVELEAPAVVQIAKAKTAEEALSALPAPGAGAREREAAPLESAKAGVFPLERVPADGTGIRRMKVPGLRRVEFDVPMQLDSRARREGSHPSGSPESGLPPRTMGAGAVVPGTLRDVMGYRLPLVSRQEVPDQIVSGVLIPAHTTFVILKAGSWELVDVTPEELELLGEAAAGREAPANEVEPARKGWNPLRIFRKREASGD